MRAVLRWILLLGVVFTAFSTLWVVAYRFINPPITSLMIIERIRVDKLEHTWRSLDQVSPNLQHAVIASEDSPFCRHYGFNLKEVYSAMKDPEHRRGGSSITQQTVKNAFLWPDASWLRKGVEAGFTVLVEALWPKQRILEVYLNTVFWRSCERSNLGSGVTVGLGSAQSQAPDGARCKSESGQTDQK